jgi:alkylation response protein AidB-like acyl-CoA dehydrogenase
MRHIHTTETPLVRLPETKEKRVELELTADQKLLRSSARSLLEKEHSLDRIRHRTAGEASWTRGWWSRAAGLGWTAVLVPEELGGGSVSGAGVRDLALLAEELGAGVAPGPVLPVNVVLAGLVATLGTGPDHSKAIEALAVGESVASWAVYEPGREWSPHEARVAATSTSDGYRLDRRPGRRRLPWPSGREPGRWEQRDGAQRHQRAAARHAPRAVR